jgi:hypothetical protein
MSFLKCIVCGSGPIKIFAVNPHNGVAKTKCVNCSITSADAHKKDKTNKVEVIYR